VNVSGTTVVKQQSFGVHFRKQRNNLRKPQLCNTWSCPMCTWCSPYELPSRWGFRGSTRNI